MDKAKDAKDGAIKGALSGLTIGAPAGLLEGLAGHGILGEGEGALAKYLLQKTLRRAAPIALGGAALGGIIGHLNKNAAESRKKK